MRKLRFSIATELIGVFLAIAIIQLVFCLYAVRQREVLGGYFDTAYAEPVRPVSFTLGRCLESPAERSGPRATPLQSMNS